MLHPPEKQVSCLHPYLPIMASSLQQPLSSVPKVAVVEWFDCIESGTQLTSTLCGCFRGG